MSGSDTRAGTSPGLTLWGQLGSVLAALALIIVLVSNLFDLNRFHASLQAARAQQTEALATTAKAEAQLDSLARGVQGLAAGGNTNAQAVMAVLASNGVRINAEPTP